MKMLALGREWGLGLLDKLFQDYLFRGIVSKLGGRNSILRFHHSPRKSSASRAARR
jgi:hypothetical protein